KFSRTSWTTAATARRTCRRACTLTTRGPCRPSTPPTLTRSRPSWPRTCASAQPTSAPTCSCTPGGASFPWAGDGTGRQGAQPAEQRAPGWVAARRARWPADSCDFQFHDAFAMYDNMDMVLAYMRVTPKYSDLDIRYALLSEYFEGGRPRA